MDKELEYMLYGDERPVNVVSLFDGMSCGRIALDKNGVNVGTYYASEIDKHAIAVSEDNYPEIVRLGDVENWREWGIDWQQVDLILAGSPCQGFSLQGKQLNFEDPRSKLFFVFADMVDEAKRQNPKVRFLLENVKMKGEVAEAISERLGVDFLKINSNLLAPQHRQRLYWTNWKIQQPTKTQTDFKKVVDEPGFRPATVRKGDPRKVVFTGEDFCCLTASYAKGIRADGRPALAKSEGVYDELKKEGSVRPLTPLECERIQTVPDNYTQKAPKTQRYKMLGNGWTVDVIAHILKEGGF